MKKKLTLAVLLLAVIGGGAVYFTQYYPEYREIKQLERLVSAQEYYGDQQARKALEDFSPARLRVLAEKGNAVTQYQLGRYYFIKGQKNLATEWFLKASNQNYPLAYRGLATIYNDKGNKESSKHYMKMAADAGDNFAKMILAIDAVNKDKDFLTGYMLVEQAANNGYPMAEAQLGHWYFDGNDNIKPDWEKAFYWLDKAYKSSLLHHQPAVFRQVENNRFRPNSVYRELAILYILGIGTVKDENKAEQLLQEHNKETKDEMTVIGTKVKLIKLKKLKDEAPNDDVKAKFETLQLELENSQDPAVFVELGNAFLYKDEQKAKSYYGMACDLRSQEGCDKYRELNQKQDTNK